MASIRKAREADAERIWRVHTSSIRDICSSHYSPEEVDSWVKRQSPEKYVQFMHLDYFIVAESDDEKNLLGFGHLGRSDVSKMPPGCEMQVKALFVAPEAQGRGVGKLLFQELEREAGAQGYTCLGVCSTLNAVSFYESCGFVVVKECVHCVGEHRLQCQILQKELKS